eukprot:NODE_10666_length_328_cov_19.157706_g9754_i0.p1 GENE.NODE_10666_length_328_cov_19.157706_g9754_i0~~NODE_10666_length_328_cov_19.157706_g9754_i0.p1  ORF type:complete len:67 (-),score=13.44 NODE_10666_length_328_cov_19.157706_g9754_i0:128-307(-)
MGWRIGCGGTDYALPMGAAAVVLWTALASLAVGWLINTHILSHVLDTPKEQRNVRRSDP